MSATRKIDVNDVMNSLRNTTKSSDLFGEQESLKDVYEKCKAELRIILTEKSEQINIKEIDSEGYPLFLDRAVKSEDRSMIKLMVLAGADETHPKLNLGNYYTRVLFEAVDPLRTNIRSTRAMFHSASDISFFRELPTVIRDKLALNRLCEDSDLVGVSDHVLLKCLKSKRWSETKAPTGASTLVNEFADYYPNPFSKEEIAQKTQLTKTVLQEKIPTNVPSAVMQAEMMHGMRTLASNKQYPTRFTIEEAMDDAHNTLNNLGLSIIEKVEKKLEISLLNRTKRVMVEAMTVLIAQRRFFNRITWDEKMVLVCADALSGLINHKIKSGKVNFSKDSKGIGLSVFSMKADDKNKYHDLKMTKNEIYTTLEPILLKAVENRINKVAAVSLTKM